MLRKLGTWSVAVLLVAGLGAAGCGSGEERAAADASAAQEAAWNQLQQMKQDLDAKRQELARAEQQVAAARAAEGGAATDEAEAAENGPTAEEAQAQVTRLRGEVQKQADEFNTQLVSFINDNPPVEGEPLTDRQQQAIRWKSGEDMLYAQEYIDQGGDYSRAIDIYKAALAVDPDNEELKAALEQAQNERYMTEDRFAEVKKGMSEDDVRQVLGPPYYANVRDFPKDNVVAWFYPTNPQRAAAAVWFRKDKKTGVLEVYKTNFTEVKSGSEKDDVKGG